MSSARQKIQDEVTCPVCLERFTNGGTHVPRILPCHHTICEACLLGIAQAADQRLFTLRCPSCRQESIFPNGSVKNFEVDFRVNRLIEVLERLQQVLFTFGIENELSSKNSETAEATLPPGELVRRRAAELRPEVTKAANVTKSELRQVELALRQNNVNALVYKKKVCDTMKLCVAMLKQREKEMVEDIERKRKTNEQSLSSQLEEVSLELTNMQSVLSLEQTCFMQVDSFEGARKAEAELLPLLEVYSERQFTEPHIPETLHPFSKELRNLTSMMSNRLSESSDTSQSENYNILESVSDSSLEEMSSEPIQSVPVHTIVRRLHEAPAQRTAPVRSTAPSHRTRSPSAQARRPLNNSLRYFSTTWGEKGTGRGQMDTPTGLAILQNDKVVVADAGNCRICIYSGVDGSFIRTFGRKGRSPGQLNCPNAVTCRGERIFVADTYNHRISVHRADGGFLTSFGAKGSKEGEFDRPIGIATTLEGNIVVADTWNHRLQIFDLEGQFLKQIGKRGSGPGEFQCPCSVALDSRGRLFVCDLDNKRVQVLTQEGEFVAAFGRTGNHEGAMHAPRAIAIDSNDYIYVTEYEKHHFQVFDSSGNFVSSYGSEGQGVGHFNKPCGIAVDTSGRMFVSDSFNHRLHVF